VVADWKHEDMSKKLFQYLVDENAIDLDQNQMRFITDLIGGVSTNPAKDREKMFIFDIVANTRNSVDVDKFDYLARDCYNMDFKSSYDFSRLMQFSRVIDNEICFHCKEVFNLYEMFHTRYSLFKQVSHFYSE
jgi:deoxynucleoside triphosphate triphosphohydrolase SAMHD1